MFQQFISFIKALGWSSLRMLGYLSPIFALELAFTRAGDSNWAPSFMLVLVFAIWSVASLGQYYDWYPYKPRLVRPNPAHAKFIIILTLGITASWLGLEHFGLVDEWLRLPLIWIGGLFAYLFWTRHPDEATKLFQLLHLPMPTEQNPNPVKTALGEELAGLTQEELALIAAEAHLCLYSNAQLLDRERLAQIMEIATWRAYRKAYLKVIGRPSRLDIKFP